MKSEERYALRNGGHRKRRLLRPRRRVRLRRRDAQLTYPVRVACLRKIARLEKLF